MGRERMRNLVPVFLFGLAMASFAVAERPVSVLEGAPTGTVLFDDDGGRAQVVPVVPAPHREPTYHGGPVVAGAHVRVLFLGSAWRESIWRQEEAKIVEVLAEFGRTAGPLSLARFGVEAREIPVTSAEDLLDPLDGRKVTDLEVQRRFERLLGRGPAVAETNTVFVIFLAPGLTSSLGNSSSGKDFLAYHNHVHASSGVVRYVVVPYDSERERWLKSARESLTQAIVNPEGNAWY
jgi:hypothetical protein